MVTQQSNNHNFLNKIKNNRLRIVYIIIVLIIIFILLFSGTKGYNMYIDLLQKHEEEKKELIKESKRKEDSLMSIVNTRVQEANNYKTLWEQQELRNRRLYGKLKNMEKSIHSVDNVFISNAMRIAESSDRFYRENDSIR